MAKQKREGGSMRLERVQTGIPGLDPLIEGGLPKGSVTLITGGAGTGKTIFGLQYLMEGARKGDKGVYINFEEETGQLSLQAKRFGWDLERLEKEGILKILSVNMTNTHVINTLIDIENMVKRMEPARLVLDSISVFGIYSQISAGAELSQLLGIGGDSTNISMNEIVERGAIMGIVNKIRGFRSTSLIISELPEETQWLSRDTVSEFICDGVIKVSMVSVGTEVSRVISVIKMRNTKHSLDTYPMFLESQGIKIKKLEE